MPCLSLTTRRGGTPLPSIGGGLAFTYNPKGTTKRQPALPLHFMLIVAMCVAVNGLCFVDRLLPKGGTQTADLSIS